MKLRAHRRAAGRRERGFAMIAILSLAALMSAYLIASALNPTGAGLASEREQRTVNALREAKTALIAYATNEQWQRYKALPSPLDYFQPGALPCPDQDGDGDADCFGSLTASMIGRLPFRTLGISDLSDASGERLWYALSHDFRKNQCPPVPTAGCTRINSDTLGQLTVVGTAPATQVVAVIFAPGNSVQGQLRDAANLNNPASYLEAFDLTNPNFTFTSSALPTDTFNDRLIVITRAELMAAVEPVVAARIQRDINPLVQAYRTVWGRYPFAKSFGAGPPANQANYMGTVNQANGLLPITNAVNAFTWLNANPDFITVTLIPAEYTSTPTVSSIVCSTASGGVELVCQIDYCCDFDDRIAIQLSAILSGPTTSFASGPTPANHVDPLTMTDRWGNPAGWSNSLPSFPPTTTISVQPKGLLVTYTGRLWNADTTSGRVTIRVRGKTTYLPIQSADPGINPNGAWFVANEWYKQTYYAVAPDLLTGGGGNCGATPPCLTVNNLSAPNNNKQAILVLAGRSLSNSMRPNGTLADYLEGANLTAANGTNPFVYQHRAGIPTAINDRVVVVAP